MRPRPHIRCPRRFCLAGEQPARGMKRHMSTPHEHESLAELYINTVVRIMIDGGWLSARDAASRFGVLHVLTAWNPGHDRPDHATNTEANLALHRELLELGCTPLAALGSDPNSDHAEHSLAASGLDDGAACALGARYGQWAVFRITAQEQTVLGCFGAWSRSRRF